MRQLIFIRHAKSDWTFEVQDFYRPLGERGHRDAPTMAQMLHKNSLPPSLFICSSAIRTYTTTQYFLEVYPEATIRLEHRLFEAPLSHYLELITSLPNDHQSIALVGHNDAITEAINYLCDTPISNLPTCGIVVMNFDIEQWTYISQEMGSMQYFFVP